MGFELPAEADVTAAAAPAVRERPRPRLVPAGRAVPPPVGGGFLLDPSPQLFHSGSTTTRSPVLRGLSPGIAVRIAPVDAAAAGLANGDAVRLVADGREVLLRARIDRRVAPGTVAVAWQSRSDGASRLMGEGEEAVTVQLRRS